MVGPLLNCNITRDSHPFFCYKVRAGSGPGNGSSLVRSPVGIRKQLTDAGVWTSTQGSVCGGSRYRWNAGL